MDALTLAALATACAPLVHPGTTQALVEVESGFNPNAIGVVAGVLEHQPRSQAEGVVTARHLQATGWNFSVGLAQINLRNFVRLGLTIETAFEPCRNLQAMQALLGDCFHRAGIGRLPQRDLRRALSCYYSGNYMAGFRDGYVERVVAAAGRKQPSTRGPPPS